jgi:hypothetical protein
MAIYDFKCQKCSHIDKDIALSILHAPGEVPMHCGQFMSYHITTPPMVVWKDPIIEPFKVRATAKEEIITTPKQRREYMARNDLLDANDTFAAPTPQEEKRSREEAQESIDAITPTAEQNQQLKESGLDSILDQ